MRHPDARVAGLVEFFEALQPRDLDRIGSLYAERALFKDPFNEVSGVDAIRRIFEHMFATLDEPRFEVHEILLQDAQCFLAWRFHFRLRGGRLEPMTIRGASHVHFDPDGRVAMHRDYWDAAEELYEKLPLLGALMRWLRRRAGGG